MIIANPSLQSHNAKHQSSQRRFTVSDKVKQPPKTWNELTPKEKRSGLITLAVIAIIAVSTISSLIGSNKPSTDTKSSAQTSTTTSSPNTPAPSVKAPERQIIGTVADIGAGTFTGGKDVAVGLYDVTPGAGQSGNFYVKGADSYNEILGLNSGLGVSKVRVKISNGDSIQISGLSQVTFTPVTTPFISTYQLSSLYSGSFIVGQDLGAGRYVVTPGAGESGNFYVTGADSYNEILGGNSAYGGVPSLTVNLTNDDAISISGLNTVTFTPTN